MNEQQQTLDTLKDIRTMMDRSSRFISLSGLSGVAAGVCALAGAWFAQGIIEKGRQEGVRLRDLYDTRPPKADVSVEVSMGNQLFMVAVVTFAAALLFAFLFTWLRSRKNRYSPVRQRCHVRLTNRGGYSAMIVGCCLLY
jgi:hypothetical protein